MRSSKSVINILLVFGSLSILAGIVMVILHSEFIDYFIPLFMGVTLIGTALIEIRKPIEKQNN